MALKFKPMEKSVEIPWIDGAILIFSRPDNNIITKIHSETTGDMSAEEKGKITLKHCLIGWKHIEDGDSGKPLEVNDENKANVLEAVCTDIDVINKVNVFLRGPLGNLPAGSTAFLTMDGTPKPAAGASTKQMN